MENRFYYPDVPIALGTLNEETKYTFLERLQKACAKRVWICCVDTFLNNDRVDLKDCAKYVRFFREKGLECGIWIRSLGFGTPMSPTAPKVSWTRLTSVTGNAPAVDAFCPEDPGFVESYLKYVKEIAACGPQLIQLDDEHCLSVRPGIGCFCHRHRKLMTERLGEEIELEGLPEKLFTGKRNKYRDAWLDISGETHLRFTSKVRDAIHEVDPAIRVGFCAGYTSWDIEGIDALSLTRNLAGDNEPFLRFTGAPYWCNTTKGRFPGQKLNTVIECAREQAAWSRDSGVEVYGEADSYPRPTYQSHANLIECFDIAMQAEGVRSLKYLFDYYSGPAYEQKYYKLHLRHIPLYAHIVKTFDGLQDAGVRLYRRFDRIRRADLGDTFVGEKPVMGRFFSSAAAMLTQLCIPVCYTGNATVGAAFGEDVLDIPEDQFPEKLILDLPAAKLLMEKGVDLGIRSVTPCDGSGAEHYYLADGTTEYVSNSHSGLGLFPGMHSGYYDAALAEDTKVLSEFVYHDKNRPSSCIVPRGKTEYFILLFDAAALGQTSSAECTYCRQAQLMDFIGGSYPAIKGESGVYCLCKQAPDGKKMAVLIENLSYDTIFDFDIELDGSWDTASLYGGEGILSPDKKRLSVTTDLPSGGALVLELSKAN